MTTRKYTIFSAVLTMLMTVSTVWGQYGSDSRTNESCEFGYRGTSSAGYRTYSSDNDFGRDAGFGPASYSRELRDFGSDVRGRFEHEFNRLRHGYDYQAPLDSMTEDWLRRPHRDDYDTSRPPARTDYGTGYRGRLDDPFRSPAPDDFGRPADDERGLRWHNQERTPRYRSRYRPAEYPDYAPDFRGLDRESPREPGFGRDDYRNVLPEVPRDRLDLDPRDRGRDLEPFVPALPRRESGSEAEAIYKAITVRYSNPVNVRAVQNMTADQALALYREVNQQTDARHLEPSSYDLRVRRGLRNLSLAVDNPAFVSAFGLSQDSFRMEGFRSTLARIETQLRVSDYQDAEQVVRHVMQLGESVGISAHVIAFEFANATIDTLDKFSALEPADPRRGAELPASEESTRTALLEGEIVGIGVEVKAHEDGLLINKVLRDGPAEEAGLRAGDVIVEINGRRIGGMALTNSVDLLTGSEGSRVRLRIVRGADRLSTVTLTRRRVRVYTVDAAKLIPGTDGVAYISLNQFGQKSTEELDQALYQLYRKGMKSLVLDLRGNPGGLLNVCVDITNRFLPCGTIVSTKGRRSDDNMLAEASYSRTWKTPLVVLIDGNSASASEIFAAAIQENGRGVIVGERSYGKGTVQTHFPLQSARGNLRLTTARFYSPKGRPMSGEGVVPDVQVVDSDGPQNGDEVLNRAIEIAQSSRLREIADAAARCRNRTGAVPRTGRLTEPAFDSVDRRVVLR